jgi:hypothetical protein
MDSAFGNFPKESRVKRPVKVEPVKPINSNELSIANSGTSKFLFKFLIEFKT